MWAPAGGAVSLWHEFGDKGRLICFEADPEECERLNSLSKLNTLYVPVALADTIMALPSTSRTASDAARSTHQNASYTSNTQPAVSCGRCAKLLTLRSRSMNIVPK
jgi:hypothetical protein